MTKVLIVENEDVTTSILRTYGMVRQQKLNTTSVKTNRQALYELRKNHYDLMIADLQPNPVDGFELIRRSKQVMPDLLAILLTEYSTENIQQMARHLPIFRALSKPVTPNQLMDCVEDALNHEIPTMQTLTDELEKLRVDLGANSVLVAQNTGNMLAYSGEINKTEIDATTTLLGGGMSASIALAQKLNQENFSQFSFFAGPPHDLYIASVDDSHFLTVIYDSKRTHSRVGLVWHYMQTAVKSLKQTLNSQQSEQALNIDGFAQSIETQMDDLLGSIPTQTGMPQQTMSTTLAQKLDTALQKFEKQTKLKVEFYLDELPNNLPSHLNKLLLGFIGEGLKNVYQHAEATIVGLSFHYEHGRLIGRMVDNGKGFQATPQFKGLTKFIQNIEQLNGQASLIGKPEQGATLSIVLPV